MALIHTPCGGGVQTGVDPETPQVAQDVQTEMIGMQAGVVNAQAAADKLYTRSPFDYADMGLNIFADVARQNAQGAGGPGGKTAAIGYSGYGVPFGPRGAAAIACEGDEPGVTIVPVNSSISTYPNQPKLTTDQNLNVPAVPPSWRQAWANRPRKSLRGGGPMTGKRLSDLVTALPGAPYPTAGPYPTTCNPQNAAIAVNSSGSGISPLWWLALIGVGLLAFGGYDGRSR